MTIISNDYANDIFLFASETFKIKTASQFVCPEGKTLCILLRLHSLTLDILCRLSLQLCFSVVVTFHILVYIVGVLVSNSQSLILG